METFIMIKDLVVLQDLQKIDLEIDSLQYNKKEFPVVIEKYNQRLLEEKNKLDIKKGILADLEKRKKRFELDLTEKEDKIKKSEEKMMAVKSNEEYQAMKKEIEMARKENALTEEQILETMLQLDEVKNNLNHLEKDLAKVAQDLQEEKKKVEEELAHIDDILSERQNNRQIKVKDLTTEANFLYHRIRVKEPLAVTETRNAKCVGCSISLPPQFYNEIQKADAIRFCPNCRRILIYHAS